MKIFLDDERKPPPGWTLATDVDEAIHALQSEYVEEISLDHDLGAGETGYDALLWIEEQAALNGYQPPVIHIHTDNPAGRKRMESALQSIKRRIRNGKD